MSTRQTYTPFIPPLRVVESVGQCRTYICMYSWASNLVATSWRQRLYMCEFGEALSRFSSLAVHRKPRGERFQISDTCSRSNRLAGG